MGGPAFWKLLLPGAQKGTTSGSFTAAVSFVPHPTPARSGPWPRTPRSSALRVGDALSETQAQPLVVLVCGPSCGMNGRPFACIWNKKKEMPGSLALCNAGRLFRTMWMRAPMQVSARRGWGRVDTGFEARPGALRLAAPCGCGVSSRVPVCLALPRGVLWPLFFLWTSCPPALLQPRFEFLEDVCGVVIRSLSALRPPSRWGFLEIWLDWQCRAGRDRVLASSLSGGGVEPPFCAAQVPMDVTWSRSCERTITRLLIGNHAQPGPSGRTCPASQVSRCASPVPARPRPCPSRGGCRPYSGGSPQSSPFTVSQTIALFFPFLLLLAFL
ncbi:uncharacterized protein LOC125110825 [Phacochoerus africanus]|uniref:uncharacterized protein LOC125110825 n=1 Tax=Phacochoerus africanus TaxID=41426 RepID=UPI001FD8B7A2|nr:uncharacterized protein LOC125110825 [Phacochoerus africanus]